MKGNSAKRFNSLWTLFVTGRECRSTAYCWNHSDNLAVSQ